MAVGAPAAGAIKAKLGEKERDREVGQRDWGEQNALEVRSVHDVDGVGSIETHSEIV